MTHDSDALVRTGLTDVGDPTGSRCVNYDCGPLQDCVEKSAATWADVRLIQLESPWRSSLLKLPAPTTPWIGMFEHILVSAPLFLPILFLFDVPSLFPPWATSSSLVMCRVSPTV